MFRLAVLLSHPIQYFAPLWRLLSTIPDLDLTVFYGSRHGIDAAFDAGFAQPVRWDVPLIEGYKTIFLPNASRWPNLHTFGGLWNPSIVQELSQGNYDALIIPGYAYATYLLAMLAAHSTKTPLLMRGESTLLGPRPADAMIHGW